ncbi:hypothetical protein [Streptococcus mitis]|jgi:hypothetical protein|uniref:hypothetical protein n=1 Tax=Streptococcus mitis TaxID=28037 RepID=UPI0021B7C260|nr:hypothetical protein [Streptococcus mitis]
MYNKISILEAKEMGMERISIKELISNGNIKRLTYFKMGSYLNQTIKTILATKNYDIKKLGYCYWSLQRPNNYKKVKRFIDTGSFKNEPCKDDSTFQSEYYVIIDTTDSKSYAGKRNTNLELKKGETVSEFYKRLQRNINSYINEINYSKGNDHSITIVKSSSFEQKYPQELFPEIIRSDGKNMAYLFAELYYCTEKIHHLKDNFRQIKMNDGIGKLKTDNQQTNFFLEVTSNETETFIKTEDVQYIVARLYSGGVAEVFPR